MRKIAAFIAGYPATAITSPGDVSGLELTILGIMLGIIYILYQWHK